MVEIEPPSGAKKIRNLTLISLGVSVIPWLIWVFFSLRSTPCNWIARIRGSECIRIISRDVDFGAEKVYFSRDNSQVLFLDGGSVRIEPVQKRSLFDSGKSIPLISVEHFDTKLGVLKKIVEFTLSSDDKLAVVCAVYQVAQFDSQSKLLLMELDHPGSARVVFPDVYCRPSATNFVPGSHVVSANSFERSGHKVLLLDIENNISRSLMGDQLVRYSENPDILPVRVDDKVDWLYSFPDLEKLAEIRFPTNVGGAMISPDGNYAFADDSHDAIIYMVDRSSGELVYTFSDKIYTGTSTFTISPNGNFLAAAFYDYDGKFIDDHATLYVWDLNDKHIIKKLLIDNHSFVPQSLDFSSDGKLLAIGTWDYVIILDLTR